MKGSGYITAQCCGSTELEIGTVYAAEMGITLFHRLTVIRWRMRRWKCPAISGCWTGSFEEIPMGIFEVSRSEQAVKNTGTESV